MTSRSQRQTELLTQKAYRAKWPYIQNKRTPMVHYGLPKANENAGTVTSIQRWHPILLFLPPVIFNANGDSIVNFNDIILLLPGRNDT